MRNAVRRFLLLTSGAGVLALAMVSAGPVAPASAASGWHRCASYTVQDQGALHLYDLRVKNVSCAEMRRVIHQYCFGPSRPAGSHPYDGSWVGKWRVIMATSQVVGDHGRQQFQGLYSFS